VSRTHLQTTRTGEEAIERICVNAYPSVVSETYARLLASHPMDPLARVGRQATLANAEGASLTCRAAWLRFTTSEIHVQAAPCNDYHLCTLLDAELQPFASLGTRTAGNARQELVILAPGGAASTSRASQGIESPSALITVLTHRVQFRRDGGAANASPFRIEDESGQQLLDLEAAVRTVDAVGDVEKLAPEQYFSDALAVMHETSGSVASNIVRNAVQKCFATIDNTERSCSLSKGWATIDHRARERAPECRAVSARAGYFSAQSHDVLELATRCDASGKPLDGARTYRVQFERWNEPPANASWFLHVAPAAAARVDLVRAEPAMTITIGPTPPNGVRENWIETLPQPQPLEVRLILCWPSERARSEIWTPPEIVAV
jgi:hypothetical protein